MLYISFSCSKVANFTRSSESTKGYEV